MAGARHELARSPWNGKHFSSWRARKASKPLPALFNRDSRYVIDINQVRGLYEINKS